MWPTNVGWEIGWAARGCGTLQEVTRPRAGRHGPQWRIAPEQSPARRCDPPRGPVAARDEALRRLETILFLAREPLSSRKLSQYANLADATEARTLVRRLNELYDQSGRAFRVEEVAGGYRLLTRPQFSRWLRRLQHISAETRLSAPALETLAVVAYRQPITRADVEAVRGVSCGELLRQLIDRDLVRLQGRSEDLGRPYLYGTTRQFLQLFGLRSLDDLPRIAELSVCEAGSPQENLDPNVFPHKASAGPDRVNEEEPEVTATFQPVLPAEELLKETLGGYVPDACCRADEGEELDEFEDDEFEDDDEDEFDDDELDEDDEFEDEEELDDEDFEDEEWEEVEDEDEEEEWDDDDEDLDWEDDDEEAEEEEEDEKWE